MTTTKIRASRRPALSTLSGMTLSGLAALSGMTLSGSTRAALVALSGVLALGGCSSGHVGDSWQCPLAAGGGCGSVAAADPAVPDGSGGPVLTEPLWRFWDGSPKGADGDGFVPADAVLADGPVAENPGTATTTPTPKGVPTPKGAKGAKASPKGVQGVRTGEVVARIWIAPFVDGSGVYREASHVRVVLEPAGWRLK